MAYPPPGAHFLQNLQNLSAMASIINMNPQQYQMPMAGIIPMTSGVHGVAHLQAHQVTGMNQSMGVTVPTGVTSISAPPVRKIMQESPSLLGAYPGLQQFEQQIQFNQQPRGRKPQSSGPTITVFVGSITERASDMLIRQLLSKCGSVNSWKRVQGANGKLQAFGFCDYSDPESAMRSIRILHDFEIADKKLVVKADAKAKEKLDEYVKQKNPSATSSESVDAIDEDTKREDEVLRTHIQAILKEHEIELSRDPDPNRDRSRRFDKRTGEPPKPENLADMEMEEEKRSLIHREIDKFRDTYKEKEKQEEREKPRDLRPSPVEGRREPEKEGDKSRDRFPRERSNDQPDRGGNSGGGGGGGGNNGGRDNRRMRNRDQPPMKERNERPPRKERERSPPRGRERERERERTDRYPEPRPEERNIERNVNVEDEEEAYERRKLERKLREKEASYQERLHNWEAREGRKVKEYEKETTKEELRREEETKEARRLKQFLEDYEDDRDDARFYKGSSMARRLRERQKEVEEDERDRRQEKRELEELRKKLAEEGHPDPDSEAKKRLNSTDIERERDKIVSLKIRELMSEARSKSGRGLEEDISLSGLSEGNTGEEIHVKSFSFMGMKIGNNQVPAGNAGANSPPDNSNSGFDKRKKLTVQDVFNPNDDDDLLAAAKRRKLPSLNDDNTDSNQSIISNSAKNSGDGSKSLSSEEKRKQIKALIENIPTSKEELFKYSIDWSVVDNSLMEKRIRPWINKKITEYIGEEEQALLDFICTKLHGRSSAQSILDDVAMVLDEEAEVFVVKMWRLLIYEIEAKKLGLGK